MVILAEKGSDLRTRLEEDLEKMQEGSLYPGGAFGCGPKLPTRPPSHILLLVNY